MSARRTFLLAAVGVTAAAVALAPSAAFAAKPAAHVKPKFVVSKLSIVHYKKTIDVATKGSVVKIQVQVKDHSKKFNPTSVKLVVTEKVTGEENATFTLKTRLVGKGKVVSNWQGKLKVPAGSIDPGAKATYCVKLVKVDDADPSTLPVVKTAKGLAGRDCFNVINSAPVPTP